MVEAARLFGASRGVDELRTFYEEKCGFTDFLMTPDKDLTGATIALLEDMKFVVEQPWGPSVSRALTLAERSRVMTPEAFAVQNEIALLDQDHRRRLWNARFSGDANSEEALDYMLQNFARRTERPAGSNEPGEDFDREMEPIGRKVQRRVLESDKAIQVDAAESGALKRLNKFRDRVKQSRVKDEMEGVMYNQLVRTSQY
jgi:hypothetical protein